MALPVLPRNAPMVKRGGGGDVHDRQEDAAHVGLASSRIGFDPPETRIPQAKSESGRDQDQTTRQRKQEAAQAGHSVAAEEARKLLSKAHGMRTGHPRGQTLPASVKVTSALRRVGLPRTLRCVKAPGFEGHVCAFRLAPDSSPIVVEAVSGRAMTLVPGDVFLGTPGHRESNRILVGGVPERGLVPGRTYWVLAECGVVGNLTSGTPLAKPFLGQARYLGAVLGEDGETFTMKQFALPAPRAGADQGARILLIVGTSAEVGKTTAVLALLSGL